MSITFTTSDRKSFTTYDEAQAHELALQEANRAQHLIDAYLKNVPVENASSDKGAHLSRLRLGKKLVGFVTFLEGCGLDLTKLAVPEMEAPIADAVQAADETMLG